MYKDKEKQKEANRQAKDRWKAKQADIAARKALGIPEKGIPEQGIPPIERIPKKFPERTERGNIRVSKPGDADYIPQCETTRAFVEGRAKDFEAGKRGKDIKCFEDLPPDVQATINRISGSPKEHRRRTGIAIRYQHLYPDRYYSTGVV